MPAEAFLAILALGIAWLGFRKIPDVFVQRKLLHIWTSIATLMLFYSIGHTYLIALSLVFALLFVFYPGKLPGKRLGLVAFPLSVAFITYFFHDEWRIWVLSLFPMFFSDPLAALCGRYGGRISVACGKTLMGGIVFFLATIFLLLLLRVDLLDAFLVSFVLTLVEISSPDGTDNLTVPLSAAVLLGALPVVPLWMSLPVSVLVAFLIVLPGWLTLCGALAVAALGTIILYSGGLKWVIPLILFVSVASIVGHILGSDEKTRDVSQVFANAGVPAFLAVLYALTGIDTLYYMNLAAVAAMLGDTLATEFGVKFSRYAYYIIGFRPVESGVSGGVSGWGFLGAFIGAVMVGAFAGEKILAVSLSGFIGTIADSLLGALVEGRGYWNNDLTNFSASLIASLVYLMLSPVL